MPLSANEAGQVPNCTQTGWPLLHVARVSFTPCAGETLPMNKRTIVALMCAIATFVCYIDRVNISVAIIPMADELNWSGTTKGFVLSSFFIGYMAAMLPTGWLANRYGGRVLMGVALAGWSLFTILTPIAAGISLSALIVTRILMGAGEAASFPAVYNLLARWFPKAERSRAAAMNLTGIPLGTIFALSTSGWLVTQASTSMVMSPFCKAVKTE